MHTVLATFLAMTYGLAHNVERLLPGPHDPAGLSSRINGESPYDEAYLRCLPHTTGASACRHTVRR